MEERKLKRRWAIVVVAAALLFLVMLFSLSANTWNHFFRILSPGQTDVLGLLGLVAGAVLFVANAIDTERSQKVAHIAGPVFLVGGFGIVSGLVQSLGITF